MKPQVAYGENNVHYQLISLSISCWSKQPGFHRICAFPFTSWFTLFKARSTIIDTSNMVNWLVDSTPLKNMSSSVGIIFPNICKNKSHVPNHQPVKTCLKPTFIPWIPPEFPLNSPSICLDPWESHPMASMDPLPPFRTVPVALSQKRLSRKLRSPSSGRRIRNWSNLRSDSDCVHKPQTAVEFNGNLTGIKRALEKGLRKNRYLQWIGSWNGHWLMEGGYHWSIRWNDYWGSNCPEKKKQKHMVYEFGVDLIASWLDVFSSWENPMNRLMMVILYIDDLKMVNFDGNIVKMILNGWFKGVPGFQETTIWYM